MRYLALSGMAAAFIGLVGAAGYLLLQSQPAPPSRTAPAAAPSLSADFAQPPASTAPAAPVPAPSPAASPPPRDDGFVIKRVLPITGPIKYGEWHWNEEGAPADGPLVMTVDLDARVLSVFRGGYEIGATAVLLGTQDKPTPLGRFPVIWKKADHYSSIYDGAPMPFTHRLTNDGIAIHGTRVEKGYASHGCIGVPNAFGKKLFAVTKLGDVVYITRGKRIGKGDSLVGG